MTTLEKSIKSQLTPEDLYIINGISNNLNEYRRYFRKQCRIIESLNYKEYSTLEEDFYIFHQELLSHNLVVNLSHLSSFIKSFQLLFDKYNSTVIINSSYFQSFLKSSIDRLTNIKNSLLTPNF